VDFNSEFFENLRFDMLLPIFGSPYKKKENKIKNIIGRKPKNI